jgi:hypothetical protein
MLEKKLLEEVKRFNAINKYSKKMIMEQDAPPPAPAEDPLGDVPPPPTGDVPPPPPAGDMGGDVPPPPADDMGTPPMDEAGMGGDTEEIDITDLVNMTKNIKNDLENNKQDNSAVINKMDDVFTKLNDLESKLAQKHSKEATACEVIIHGVTMIAAEESIGNIKMQLNSILVEVAE